MNTAKSAEILIADEGDGLTRVVLNRPDRLNALTPAMVEELRAFFERQRRNPTTRVIVLSSTGKHFCAGLDIDTLPEMPAAQFDRVTMMEGYTDLIASMRACPQPVICLIQGAATGFGFALTLACDIRYASDDAKVSVAMVKLGAPGCDLGISYFLPRIVGLAYATELMLTGDKMAAEEALRIGLVTKVCSREEIGEAGTAMARKLLQCSPLGLRLTKQGINFALDATGLEQVLMSENKSQLMTVEGTKEGAAEFRGKGG